MAMAQIQVPVSELKMNLSKYLSLAESQDVFVTRHGKPVVKMCSTKVDRRAEVEELLGMFPEGIDVDYDKMKDLRREERFG